LRYELTFCRQSSYQLPYMTIYVNVSWIGGRKYGTFITVVQPNYNGFSQGQPCYGQTGTVSGEFTYPNFWNVEYTIWGSRHQVPVRQRRQCTHMSQLAPTDQVGASYSIPDVVEDDAGRAGPRVGRCQLVRRDRRARRVITSGSTPGTIRVSATMVRSPPADRFSAGSLAPARCR